MPTPEEKARQKIDVMLVNAGWVVQDYGQANIHAGRGVVLRNFPLTSGHGFADYLLYIDGKAAGIVEAKKEGVTLTGVEVQAAKYSKGLPQDLPAITRPLPFLYQSTGVETRFTNGLDPQPRSRPVFSFHRPETLAAFIPRHSEAPTQKGLANSSIEVHPPGTVLLGMIGEGKTRGQTAILEIAACNNQNSAAIRVSEAGIPPEYVYRYLEGQYAENRSKSSGNNQPSLNKARVQGILLPLPLIAEQQQIVAEVERRLSVIEELEASVQANLTRANRLRQSILSQAFAGRLLPCRSDEV